MSTQAEIERTERLITAIELLSERLDKISSALERPPVGWIRMLEEFKGAVSRIPTTIRTRF